MNRDFITKKLKPQMRMEKWKMENGKWKIPNRRIFKFPSAFFPLLSLICAALCLFSACGNSQKTDLRTLAPAETLVYLETNDLGDTLNSLTGNEAWKTLAASQPDFSQLKNTQIAVVVTGFETSEKQIANESSILNFKPHFVIIADTHQWKSTAVSIAESQIGKFARKTYGDDVKLDKSEERDAKIFIWTAGDGQRKLFSAVSGGVIYAGNDKAVLDKCLAVARGEEDNLTKNENLARARENAVNSGGEGQIAFGYVSQEGAAQIANIIGVSTAIQASEEDATRTIISRILPAILQKTVREVSWTARKSETGIEDKILLKTDPETSSVLKETLVPAGENQSQLTEFVPSEFYSVTRYNIQNPQLAWHSVLLSASKNLDAASAKILPFISSYIFNGVSDGDLFLSGIGAEIITARFDEEEKQVVIAEVKDVEKVKKSISEEINFKAKPEKQGAADFWKSEDGDSAAALIDNKLILGETESVLNCLKAKESGQNLAQTNQFQNLIKSPAISTTVTKDDESAPDVINVLGNLKEDNKNYKSLYSTETRFNQNGFERKTVSDFGLLGTILGQLGKENS